MLCCGKKKNYFICEVVMLDGTVVYFNKNENLKLTSKPCIIFNKICSNINLIEKEYFGLKYLDANSKQIWLNLTIRFNEDQYFMKDASHGPCTLYFGVKYYAPDPCILKEEVTRYQFFLQLKQDILNGKLSCSWKKLTELSALALQCEFIYLKERLIIYLQLSWEIIQYLITNEVMSLSFDLFHIKMKALSMKSVDYILCTVV